MSGKTILYVDDDADDRELFVTMLHTKNQHIDIVEATNGREALDYLLQLKKQGANFPCLIVLDINMPVLDGKETFQCLHADDILSKVPVIVLSSSLNHKDKTYFSDYGVQLIPKPTEMKAMDSIAGNLISYCA